jgi:hypothetical protein
MKNGHSNGYEVLVSYLTGRGLRDAFHEAGYVAGMIIFALFWPLMLWMLAVIGILLLGGRLLGNLFRLFREKR